MSYLTKKQIENRLKIAHASQVKALKKYGKSDEALRLMVNNTCPIKWMPRKELFSIANLTFNPDTGTAYSYKWYEIAKVFKGKMILNDHAYSPSTSKHCNKLSTTFDALGIKYSRIKAPEGLQRVEEATRESLLVVARELIKAFHARGSKVKELTPQLLRDRASDTIETLKLMGVRVTLYDLNTAIVSANNERESRLERSRKRAYERRIEAEQLAMGFTRMRFSEDTHYKASKASNALGYGTKLIRQIDSRTEFLMSYPLDTGISEDLKSQGAQIGAINILNTVFQLITVTE